MDPTLKSVQANNCLQLSRDAARIRDDDHGLKSNLVASNEDCWLVASGVNVEKVHDKCRIIIRKEKPELTNSLKGAQKKSSLFVSKLEAEINWALQF